MTTVIIVIVVVLLLLAALRLWLTANRLDRLHVRTEAAWAALEGALTRRVVAARALAAAGGLEPERAALLRGAARRADGADRRFRAGAETELSTVLSTITVVMPPDLQGELADAEERLTLARRFYNDAVRDTRALREAWFTRLFRLAGSAALPQYFELADPPVRAAPATGGDGAAPSTAVGDQRRAAAAPQLSPVRRSGRVVVVDEADRILLFRAFDPGRPDEPAFWMTPGGGLEPGEDELACAVRELREETGIRVCADDLAGPVWVRRAQFEFMGEAIDSLETFFALRVGPGTAVGRTDVDVSGFTPVEQVSMMTHRWWTAAELSATAEIVYPVELATRLGELRAALVHTRRLSPVPID